MGIPYKVMEMQSKEWYYKWTEGVIVGYLKGTIEEKRALGMLKRAKENIGEEDLKSLIKAIEISPIYLPSMPKEEKIRKINELLKLPKNHEIIS